MILTGYKLRLVSNVIMSSNYGMPTAVLGVCDEFHKEFHTERWTSVFLMILTLGDLWTPTATGVSDSSI